MTSDQKNALLFIHGKGQASVDQIAEALNLNAQAVEDLLYELRTANLITNSTTRHKSVCLALAGHRAIPQLKRGETPVLPPARSPQKTSAAPGTEVAPRSAGMATGSGKHQETKSAPPPPCASVDALPPAAKGGAGEVGRLPVVLANLPIDRAPGVMLDIDFAGPGGAATTLKKEIAHARAPDESPAPSGEIDGSATPKITEDSEPKRLIAETRTEQREGSPPKQDADPRRDVTAGATSDTPYVQQWDGPPLTADHAVAAMESLASGQVGTFPSPLDETVHAAAAVDVESHVRRRLALQDLRGRPKRDPAHVSVLLVDELRAIAARCEQRAKKETDDASTLRRAIDIVASENGPTAE